MHLKIFHDDDVLQTYTGHTDAVSSLLHIPEWKQYVTGNAMAENTAFHAIANVVILVFI